MVITECTVHCKEMNILNNSSPTLNRRINFQTNVLVSQQLLPRQ